MLVLYKINNQQSPSGIHVPIDTDCKAYISGMLAEHGVSAEEIETVAVEATAFSGEEKAMIRRIEGNLAMQYQVKFEAPDVVGEQVPESTENVEGWD